MYYIHTFICFSLFDLGPDVWNERLSASNFDICCIESHFFCIMHVQPWSRPRRRPQARPNPSGSPDQPRFGCLQVP
jgi:hypothetical protein